LLSPYCHGDDHQPAFNEALVRHCDLYLAITGGYWFADIEKSGYKHWLPKMRHLDLAIDRAEFPSIKRSFNPVGRRRIVYIGSDAWYKNTRYLAAIAESMPETEFGWIGTDRSVGNIEGLGHRSLTTAEGRALVSGYDILLTVGKADGNPATILEAMAWGLIPVCTPQSGYVGFQSILNVPINDTAGAVQVLWSLLVEPEARLREIQEQNWRLLDEYFNWDRFAAQVVAAIESEEAPACVPVSIGRRLELLFAEIFNPFWANLLDPRKMRKRLRKIQVV
jgi:glycosyltransferase involved in cell wall biosynthesis